MTDHPTERRQGWVDDDRTDAADKEPATKPTASGERTSESVESTQAAEKQERQLKTGEENPT